MARNPDVTPRPKSATPRKATAATKAPAKPRKATKASPRKAPTKATPPARKAQNRKPVEAGRTLDSGALAPGALVSMVAAHLEAAEEPVGPSAIAKALGRSAGAVRNACDSLVKRGTATLVSEKPRQYRKAA